jgi:hypothetical protein
MRHSHFPGGAGPIGSRSLLRPKLGTATLGWCGSSIRFYGTYVHIELSEQIRPCPAGIARKSSWGEELALTLGAGRHLQQLWLRILGR